MIVYKYRVYKPEENKIIPRIDTTMPNSGLGIMVDSQKQNRTWLANAGRGGVGKRSRRKKDRGKEFWTCKKHWLNCDKSDSRAFSKASLQGS